MIKLTDPKNFEASFFGSVITEKEGNVRNIILSDFFAETDGELKLTVFSADGVYYVHDNGCAVRRLKHNCKYSYKEKLEKVCSGCIRDEKVLGSFCQVFHFFYYLQALIFIANADMIADDLDSEFYCSDIADRFPDADFADSTDDILEKIKNEIIVGSRNDNSVWISFFSCYSLNSSTVGFLIEQLEDGTFKISDSCKGNIEGEIFESFYWANDDISLYSSSINRFCRRFFADFDGKDVSVTALSEENLINSLFRFINLAVLLSEFGRLIKLPELN